MMTRRPSPPDFFPFFGKKKLSSFSYGSLVDGKSLCSCLSGSFGLCCLAMATLSRWEESMFSCFIWSFSLCSFGDILILLLDAGIC